MNSRLLVNYFEFLLFCANDFQHDLIHRIGVLAVNNKLLPHFVQSVHYHTPFKVIQHYEYFLCHLIVN